MSVQTTTHLNFRGTARAALEHYRDVFGGQLQVFTYADAHRTGEGAVADEVVWGQVESPAGLRVMAFDVPPQRPYDAGRDAVFVSVRGDDADEITRYFEGLADGGVVREALAPSGFSPWYGMVTDRFGVTWVLDVAVAYEG
jgi:PhnB protein